MNTRSILTFVMVSLVALSACDQDVMMSEKGVRLPDGDVQAGREAFLYMQCNQCHTIKGEQLPGIPGQDPPYVELGGDVTQVKTYGQLITAIINPSHKLATGYAKEVVSEDDESKMYVYNDHMTVKELIDLVMFLQPHYNVLPPSFRYPVYP
ncbi:MAG: cytochrome C [Gammaproteobacteria bacterium]|nr:cytochrome C [Gammaproteobacteria bacterium]NNC55970.1 cytochrome C [Woeseiaceae bacterium]